MPAYKLPNGIRIDMDLLIDAVLIEDEFPHTYFDTETGAVISIPSTESLAHWVMEIGNTPRYIAIEHFTDQDRDGAAKDFLKLFKKDMDKEVHTEASRALTRDGWRGMEYFLEEDGNDWDIGWDQYLGDEAWECLQEWLLNIPNVPIKTEFEGCGNCAICQLVQTGEGADPAKLLDAFKTEEIMQHVAKQMQEHQQQKGGASQEKVPAPAKNTGSVVTKKHVDRVLAFKITLDASDPSIWRRILVPADYTFFDLHCAIQDAMGWEDEHLHSFPIESNDPPKTKSKKRGKIITIEWPNPDQFDFGGLSETHDERKELLADWFGARITQCIYAYDFGDDWNHTVVFEGEKPREAGVTYPRCIAGENACPPENCGGIFGYIRLQNILKDSKHEEHTNILDWLDLKSAKDFDPTRFDPDNITFQDPKKRIKAHKGRYR